MSSKPKTIDLSIVIPALNEGKRLGKSLDELSKFLKSDPTMKRISCEVIVVSANSSDDTHEVAKTHGKKIKNFSLLLPGEKVGKGRDVQYGMLRSNGKYALFMDADLATPIHHLPVFYNEIQKGYNVVAATRNLKKHHSHFSRRLLSITGNTAYGILGGVWTQDSQCGFKLFDRRAIDICFGKQTIMKWGFDMEILTIAKVNRLSVKFLEITDWEDVPGGTFASDKIIKNALGSLIELIKIALNRISRTYI